MNRKVTLITAGAVIAAAAVGLGSGAALAQSGGAAARAGSPVPGNTVSTTYACVDGPAFEYYQFNTPLPHTCRYPGQSRVALPTITLAQGADFPIEIATSATTDEFVTCTVQQVALPGQANQLGLACTQLAS